MFRIIGANLYYIIYFHNNFLEKKKKDSEAFTQELFENVV